MSASLPAVGSDRPVRALRGTDDGDLARGRGQRGPCPCERLDQGHVAGERHRSRIAHLAHDEHAPAAVLLDRHGDLRIREVAVSQLLFQLALDLAQRQAAGRDPADERKGECAVGLDGVLAAEIRLVEHLHREHILRTDDVVRGG